MPSLACESERKSRSFADEHYIERVTWSFAIATKNAARQPFDPGAEFCLVQILNLVLLIHPLPWGLVAICHRVIRSKPGNFGQERDATHLHGASSYAFNIDILDPLIQVGEHEA